MYEREVKHSILEEYGIPLCTAIKYSILEEYCIPLKMAWTTASQESRSCNWKDERRAVNVTVSFIE
jgi:hypothetical protein